jgi:tetratricopeptide (TPR) repeat protein
VSKANTIRKKALDLVRQQDWPNAIKEYRRLIELDQNNPNVHNELADLYLRTNQKAEAFDSFSLAIDEYTRVGLFNNAVAVCKKVLRVLPARVEVLNKLGLIRMKQGLAKEAESYYLSFLDKAAGGSFESDAFLKLAGSIAEEMPSSTAVLQRLAQCLLGYRLNDEAADVLIKLYVLQQRNGDTSGCEDTRALVTKLGVVAKLDAIVGKNGASGDRTVVTEDNLWTKKHSEGERIDIESTPRFTPPNQPTTAPAPQQPAGAVSGGPSERDQWLLRLARGVGGSAPKSKAPAPAETPPPAAAPEPTTPPPAVEPQSVVVTEEMPNVPVEAAVEPDATTESVVDEDPIVDDGVDDIVAENPVDEVIEEAEEEDLPPIPSSPAQSVVPPYETPKPKTAPAKSAPKGETVQISALIQDAEEDLSGEEDYRSHYDLGMAYIEMDFALGGDSRVPDRVEIAAVPSEVSGDDRTLLLEAEPGPARDSTAHQGSIAHRMGIKYNLGLAYEMIGDKDNARAHFEDVYVVDVTFRDVADKIRALSDS